MGGFKGTVGKGGKGKGKGKGPVIPTGNKVSFCVNGVNITVVSNTPKPFCLSMSLADANTLLVALSSAINNAAVKKSKTGGKGKGK